jgi:hypothetical protein
MRRMRARNATVAAMPEGLSDAQIIERLEWLERNMRMLAERIGAPLEDPADAIDRDIVDLARAGQRMQAAKLYAERTGADFVTAQRVVNGL